LDGSGPQLEEVRNFFVNQDFPLEEGEVFYYYYQGLGWRGENGCAIRDWKSAANDWLENLC
jgi:hypothetical protein